MTFGVWSRLSLVSFRISSRIFVGNGVNHVIRNVRNLCGSDPAVLQYAQHLCREEKSLRSRRLFEALERRSALQEQLSQLDELKANDKSGGLDELVEEERREYEKQLVVIHEDIGQLVSEMPSYTSALPSECEIEVSAGVGGREAMLFTSDLVDMYTGYAAFRGWSLEVAELDTADRGEVRHACLLVAGAGVHEILKLEAGVHRVQRVPETEKSGRIHTSTVTVSIALQPTEIDVQINDRDLRIETKRSSGAGGQHVNTTDSCVRITHIPTGLSVECQQERDQHRNKKMAFKRLRMLLYQRQLDERDDKTRKLKKSQVGSGLRNEKIRTYNFNQDRVTDHRLGGALGTVHDLKGILSGGASLDALISKLQTVENERNLLDQIEFFRTKINSKISP